MPADDLIGSVICDRFEILDKLGQGGMGSVYRAFQRSVKREVAIKLINASFSRDPDAVRRFEREAQLASRLSHPNTVSVFDFGQTDDGRLFIAMELIKGRTLFERLAEDGVFTAERAVRIGSQICDALEAAHALGIIHRDLKLDNVIVLDQPPGRDLLKVLDFGLAKLFGELSSGSTSPGVFGTPRYIAPEVATTGVTEPAADIYALGVILGELTVGKPLWSSDQLIELVPQKLAPAPAIALVPPALRRVVTALIDPDPKRRPNASQARTLLRTVADGSITFPPIDLHPPTRGKAESRAPLPRSQWPWVLLGGLAIAVAVFAILVIAGVIDADELKGLLPGR
ncbi:MAG: serine/threonine protein kinase [Myxococcales bacterium]|nr:serine/threonine protein kinase [Myxococcales bacterium]